MTSILFEDEMTPDSVPPLADVEHPCEKCGRETGWSGRGRRKKFCESCKPSRTSSGVKVTGNTSNMAAQAAKTLTGINGVFALLIGGLGFTRTMKAAFDGNETFEQAAYQALLTDPKLCAQILNVGETSGKITLGLAYFTYGMGLAPTLAEEYKAKKAQRLVDMEE